MQCVTKSLLLFLFELVRVLQCVLQCLLQCVAVRTYKGVTHMSG